MVIKKIIVFGGNGMLGNYISTYFGRLKDQFTVVSLTRKDYDAFNDGIFKLENLLLQHNIDSQCLVINCIGIIPQASKNYSLNNRLYIKVNAVFPNQLSLLCEKYGAKMIHPTTDCVYTGEKGGYTEDDVSDVNDIYGITKSLGEPTNCMVVRTSIIGEETRNKRSLVEWVKSNQNKEINGFTNHLWNGITCLEYAKFIHKVIDNNLFWKGVRHILSPTTVSKHQLVEMINQSFGLGIVVNEFSTGDVVDKTLNSKHKMEVQIKELKDQIDELADFELN